MQAAQTRMIGIGLLFVGIFVSGFWLSQLGRPYNGWVLTAHKLLSLAALIFLGIVVYKVQQNNSLHALELSLSILCALFFITTIITGGLLSMANPFPPLIHKLHQITPFLTVMFAAVTLYLLLFRR